MATERSVYLATLGVLLYRAGRFVEAIHRLEEAIAIEDAKSVPRSWAFFAMAHYQLGHGEEARRWRNHMADRKPNPDPKALRDDFEIRLVQTEAEAVMLYDPIFPADPFTH